MFGGVNVCVEYCLCQLTIIMRNPGWDTSLWSHLELTTRDLGTLGLPLIDLSNVDGSKKVNVCTPNIRATPFVRYRSNVLGCSPQAPTLD